MKVPRQRTRQETPPIEVDPRLLQFLPFYKELFARNNPGVRIPDEVAREAYLAALRESGAIKEVKTAEGTVRLEPTDEFLRAMETRH